MERNLSFLLSLGDLFEQSAAAVKGTARKTRVDTNSVKHSIFPPKFKLTSLTSCNIARLLSYFKMAAVSAAVSSRFSNYFRQGFHRFESSLETEVLVNILSLCELFVGEKEEKVPFCSELLLYLKELRNQ